MTSRPWFAGIQKRLLLLMISLAFALLTPSAKAACVNGVVNFWWELGNYCDTGDRDCTDWRFTDSKQDTFQPLKQVIFDLETTSGTLLATGDVNASGEYSVCYSGTQSQVVLKFYPEHRNGDFKIQTSTGGRWVFSCTRPGSGTHSACNYGSNGNPNAVASVYFTAYAFDTNSASKMDRVDPLFTNVAVQMDSSASETDGWDKVARLSGTIMEEFGFRGAMHEMAHIAHHLSSRNQYLGPDSSNKAYGVDLDACGGDNYWQYESQPECPDLVYVESVAELLAAWARQKSTASNPCSGTGYWGRECWDESSNNRVDLEQNVCPSSGPVMVKQGMQFLWDTFDSSMGIPEDDYDEILYHFPNGRGDHDKSENWCCLAWSCWRCNHYETNIRDFAYHLQSVTGNNPNSLLNAHCL